MKMIITEYDFINLMKASTSNFSTEGLVELFNHLEEYSTDDGDYTFSPAGASCTFIEYDNIREVLKECTHLGIESIEELREHTTVLEIPHTNRIIIQDF